jgi:hypothetical protein
LAKAMPLMLLLTKFRNSVALLTKKAAGLYPAAFTMLPKNFRYKNNRFIY